MKTELTIDHDNYVKIASGDKHMLKLKPSQEPDHGLVRLKEFGNDNHIDIFVKSKRKIAGSIVVKFDLIAIYGVG